jgi:hypothetical protein
MKQHEETKILLAKAKEASKRASFYSFVNFVIHGPLIKKCPVMVDSGCSMNMTPRGDLLEDVTKLETPIRIVLADGEVSTMSTNVGKLHLTAVTKDVTPGEVKIEQVAYVPTLESTLLSVKAMTACGSEFTFKKKESVMKDSTIWTVKGYLNQL